MNEPIVTNSNEPTELLAPQDLSGLAFLDPASMPDLDNAETGISLETKYFEFNTPNQTVRAIFNGLGKMNKRNSTSGELEELDAIYFQTKDGVYLNGGDNLVNQLRHVKPGTAIQITYLGKQKTNSGNNVNKFDVRLLNVNKVQYKNEQLATPFWERANELFLSREEGMAHLAEFGNDFQIALQKLNE